MCRSPGAESEAGGVSERVWQARMGEGARLLDLGDGLHAPVEAGVTHAVSDDQRQGGSVGGGLIPRREGTDRDVGRDHCQRRLNDHFGESLGVLKYVNVNGE